MSDSVLAIEGVAKSFGANQVLANVCFSIRKGEIVGLLGPNGCGKSTLLNLISGVFPADAGTLAFQGENMTGQSMDHIARRGLVRTFQLPSMPRRMTVAELLHGAAARGAGFGSLFRRDASEMAEIDGLLDELALSHVRYLPAASLSGGQKKLLSIALALRASPRMICLDEPTAGVHPNLRHHMVGLLRRINASGITLLIVEHDMHFIRELCSRCVVMDRGAVIADCKPSELTSNEQVVEAYLGNARQKRAMA
ncbi:ABC transporter ATP-binding protein [Shinella sumterensis]|uniref:ABC transporter ATP-binding protein n=1 Tax=Shinella sumterensis TaxID=1967501 RepID=UPI00106EC729|nr:ABC transporter ATP-binding protein [Shinella sumterensis]MCD1266380.1 ATP-binding cassette domain-containing protein [Shinella sumterensis]TFE97263.1 ABC transporter ATP-binding protein [Shinella sumterensis]